VFSKAFYLKEYLSLVTDDYSNIRREWSDLLRFRVQEECLPEGQCLRR
jgi:hypothetical protein